MIACIGVMMGFYIITRCASFATRKDDRAESMLVRIFSIITIVVTILCMIPLFGGGSPNM